MHIKILAILTTMIMFQTTMKFLKKKQGSVFLKEKRDMIQTSIALAWPLSDVSWDKSFTTE